MYLLFHFISFYYKLIGFLFSVLDLTLCPEEQILNGNQPDMDDFAGGENQDEEAVAMIEESPSGNGIFLEDLSYEGILSGIFVLKFMLKSACITRSCIIPCF